MKKIKFQNTILFILIINISFSCVSKKNTVESSSLNETNSKLIFLNYTLSETSNGKKKIEFINKIITDGKLKNNSNKYIKTGSIGDLKCSQLDNKSKTLQSIFIKNPLNKTIEFVNDSLQLESKALKLKKASLSLRLQLNAKTKNIVIAEIIDTLQNTKTLYITKLKTK